MTDWSLLTTDDVEAIIARIEEHSDINAVEELLDVISSESTPQHVKLRAISVSQEILFDGTAGPRPANWDELFGPDDAAIEARKAEKP